MFFFSRKKQFFFSFFLFDVVVVCVCVRVCVFWVPPPRVAYQSALLSLSATRRCVCVLERQTRDAPPPPLKSEKGTLPSHTRDETDRRARKSTTKKTCNFFVEASHRAVALRRVAAVGHAASLDDGEKRRRRRRGRPNFFHPLSLLLRGSLADEEKSRISPRRLLFLLRPRPKAFLNTRGM